MAKKPKTKDGVKPSSNEVNAGASEFASAIKSTGVDKWYAVLLRDRGPNVNTVNMIEQAAGGDKTQPTPYQVAAYPVRPPADYLEHRFDLAGADAAVQEV